MPDPDYRRISRCFSATRDAVRRPHHIPDPIPFGPLAVGGALYQLQPDEDFVGVIPSWMILQLPSRMRR
jgi:hypothetical protein